MNYLVVLRTSLDDVPIKLFPDRLMAEALAGELVAHECTCVWPKRHQAIVRALKVAELDWCDPSCIAVYKFRTSGTLAGIKIIGDIWNEEHQKLEDKKAEARSKKGAQPRKKLRFGVLCVELPDEESK